MGAAASAVENEVDEIKGLETLPDEIRGTVVSHVETFLKDVINMHAQSEVEVTVFRAANLLKMDSRSDSDPYVCLAVTEDGQTRKADCKIGVSSMLRNTNFPNWNHGQGETVFFGPGHAKDFILVKVLDSDGREPEPDSTKDDLLGSNLLSLADPLGSHGRQITIDLEYSSNEGNVSAGSLTLSFRRILDFPQIEPETSIRDLVLSYFPLIPEWDSSGRDIRQECIKTLQGFLQCIQTRLSKSEKISSTIPILFDQRDTHATLFHRIHASLAIAKFPELIAELETVDLQSPPLVEQSIEPQDVFVRKEIRTMRDEDQLRFIAAVKRMMESDTPGGSEWLRIAGYHGWPSNDGDGYCVHRAEAFPGWHRAYLLEMEQALQRADAELGNDGRIALPYWDFSIYEIQGQVMPKLIRDHFSVDFKFPDNFFPESQDGTDSNAIRGLKSIGFSRINSDDVLMEKLRKSNITRRSADCLDIYANPEHWQHASTENVKTESVEGPHNSVHNAIGFPLTSLKVAAFHPMFWLLHCNTVRQYEKYLALSGRESCKQELINHQNILEEQGAPNLFEQDCVPFSRPKNIQVLFPLNPSRGFTLHDSLLELHCLGYSYDMLPPQPKQQMRELPTFAFFKDVDVATKLIGQDGSMKSFDMHVFVVEKTLISTIHTKLNEILQQQLSSSPTKLFEEIENYAGIVSLFGGKGPKCKNCRINRTINAKVELNDALARLGHLSRFDAELVVVAEDEFGELAFFENIQAKFGNGVEIPAPTIVGPMFESGSPDLSKVEEGTAPNQSIEETRALQMTLSGQGFYSAAVDGFFGEKTLLAVKEFQKFSGIKDDGIVGPVTKAVFTQPRFDKLKDISSASDGKVKIYTAGQRLKYWVGTCPGYLPRESVLGEIKSAFAEWEVAKVFMFEKVEEKAQADISIQWSDRSLDNGRLFDGVGGEIARADSKGITLDISERWSCTASDPSPRSFRILSVVLHELGHVFGLDHTSDMQSILFPYYLSGRIRLGPSDTVKLQSLYKET